MKTVIVVSYNFPPVGGAGVQRPVKFVKYISKYGWKPVVVTVANPSVPVIDKSLENDIPIGVRIYKASTLEPSYEQKQGFTTTNNNATGRLKKYFKIIISRLLLPDLQVLWWPGLVWTLIFAIRKEHPACLFVTAPPFSSFIPVIVVGRLFGVPVVLDYRDEWTFSRNAWENASRGRLVTFIDTALELFVCSQCAAFTAANASYVASLNLSYPKSAIGKGHVITNGFDEEDFEVRIRPPLSVKANDKITFIYTGTVWAATSFKSLLAAFEKLLLKQPGLSENITLKIIGRVVDSEALCFENNAVSKIVELCGYIEHDRIFEEMYYSDVLLLTLSDLPGAEKIICGKAFEYMASGKHIFAVVPDGETKNVICANYDNATIANPSDVHSVLLGIMSIIENISLIRAKRGNDVSQFSRRELTADLVKVFDVVAVKNDSDVNINAE